MGIKFGGCFVTSNKSICYIILSFALKKFAKYTCHVFFIVKLSFKYKPGHFLVSTKNMSSAKIHTHSIGINFKNSYGV